MNDIIEPRELNEDEYAKFIASWIDGFTLDLKDAWPNLDTVKTTIEARIKEALSVSMGVMVIYDYFAISYPGILHSANDSEIEQEQIYELFELVMKEIVDEIT